ncbi:MAG: peptide-binding protein [Vulcanimicrobiaceae bacterium]
MDTLNPALAYSYAANAVSEAMFDGLVKLDAHGVTQPDLALRVPSAANGGLSADGTTLTYHLREDVRWHDGAPFTSADVAFTFKVLRDPHINGANRAVYALVTSLETPDAYTVRVHLRHPSVMAANRLFCVGWNGGILPKHLLGHSRDVNRDAFNQHPVGTGPYAFRSWERGSRLVLQANHHYFAREPQIERLEILEVPNANTLLNLISTRQIDVATVRPALMRSLPKDSPYTVIVAPSPLLLYLVINTARTPLDRRAIRVAMAKTLDRARLARLLTLGIGSVAQSFVAPFNWAYTPRNGAPPYDPHLSDALRGLDIAITHSGTNDGDVTRQGALLVASAWQQQGARVSIRQVGERVMYGDDGVLARGNFDVAFIGHGFDVDPDITDFVVSRSIPPRSENYARYRDANIDRWSAAALTIYDPQKRAPYYAAIQRRLNRDLPYIPIAWVSIAYAVNPRLHGFQPETTNSDLWNVADWHF